MTATFWIVVALVIYTYAGYPLFVQLLARFRGSPDRAPAAPARWPTVSVIVAVHNGEPHVRRKAGNLAALAYPGDPPEIIFVSDGSDDGTDSILRELPGIVMARYQPRSGKPTALNLGATLAGGEVLVFTDVRQLLDGAALPRLVARLLEPGVGAVSGELCHRDAATGAARDVGLYWRYEKAIRRAESRLHSTAGVTGALYAIRRSDFGGLPGDTILDDFEVPARVLRTGRRVVLESGARCYDELENTSAGERRRKVRTLAGNFQSFARNPWLFLPWRNPVFWQFVSHKVLRLLVPYALLAALVLPFAIGGTLYRMAFVAQALFYLMALAGLTWQRLRAVRVVSFAAVFVELNWAAVAGLGRFLGRRIDVRWAT
ncbi:MAG TPA: glycosyltransferase family 2 protein [Gammaproteobacteria bacterium]|nr:glycosyltransferase family 2 protein [Gammaproteobacteria bacterium]